MPRGHEQGPGEYVQPDLLSSKPPLPGEKGYLPEGFRADKNGRIFDEAGNEYDGDLEKIVEAPSEHLLRAQKLVADKFPSADPPLKKALIAHYTAEFRPKDKKVKTDRKNESHQ